MYSRVLKATKFKKFNKKMYGLDIETYDNNKKFLCATIWYDDTNLWVFTDKRELINFLKTKRFWNSLIVATNLGFDFMGIFNNEPELMNFKFIFRGSSLINAKTYIINQEFNPKYIKGKNRNSINFLDTINYCPFSVEKLGNIIKCQKMKKPDRLGLKPLNKTEMDYMIEYNINDAKISKLFMEFLYNSINELGGTAKMTIAGSSMRTFTDKYIKDKIYFRHNSEELKEQFNAYYGGRTEVFSRGLIENYNYYDINSLYPSVMRDFTFPNPNTKRITMKNDIKYILQYDGVAHVDVWCPENLKVPLLPYRHNNKLIFPTGSFSGWYSNVELRKAIELGYVIKFIKKVYYFKENCEPFKDFVNDMYAKRLKYQEEKNPMELVTKLMMNSLYGKFGQKFTDKEELQPFNLTIEELDKLDNFERIGNFIRIKHKEKEPNAFCIPIWALYVTAYARLRLYEYLSNHDVVYCDTDSVITKDEIKTSKELGKMKLELKIKRGVIVKPKFYGLVYDKDNKEVSRVKIKGLGCMLDELRFRKLLESDSHREVYIKFVKFKESLRRGLIPNETMEVYKEFNLEDNKRNWTHNFSINSLQASLPINLSETETFINTEINLINEVN